MNHSIHQRGHNTTANQVESADDGYAHYVAKQHRTLLANSAISPEVAEARWYRSVDTKAALRRKHFGASQLVVPTLLIPIWDVHGKIATFQRRPDAPRLKNGKPVKYEIPHGARMVLDVPPPIRRLLKQPAIPLFITEGVPKADSAVSQGLCCIDLLGVWNFRGTNEHGGKTALAD